MKRRDFVSRVVLGGAAACTTLGGAAHAAPSSGVLQVPIHRLDGIRRAQRPVVPRRNPGPIASPRHARAVSDGAQGSPSCERASGWCQRRASYPSAFDTELEGTHPCDFVYRSLENTSLEVISGQSDRVVNEATQMAHLDRIAPGKRLRGNLEKWASSTISLRGGKIENSSAHPDAGKMWSFGSHRQQLTDAVNYRNLPGTATEIRLTSGRRSAGPSPLTRPRAASCG